jgi:hypothetical protein
MPNTTTLSTAEAVAALCTSLDPARQASLLDFARFLKAQEAATTFEEIDEADEAAWDREFADPVKSANLARWVDESLAEGKPRRINPAQL